MSTWSSARARPWRRRSSPGNFIRWCSSATSGSFLPDTATAIEQGITSLHAYSWFGFFGPAGTPKPVIDGFYRHVAAAVREEANYNTFVNKFRSEVVLPPPDELRQMIVEELPFWGKIIRDNNIKSGAG